MLDSYLSGQILDALIAGNLTKVAAYSAIFFLIWREVKGMRKEFSSLGTEFKILNRNVSEALAAGEKRFEAIEANVGKIDLRLNTIEVERKATNLKGDS